MTAENILTLLGINGGVFVAVFFILRWLLQRTIEAKIDVMKAKEIEAFKVELSKELESAKHRLELEHTRTAIIYENQRSSFSNIIKAMHGAIRVIELSYNSATETWEPIEERDLENFRKLVMEESLFVGKECESVLNLYIDVMSEAVDWQIGEPPPKEAEVRRAYDQLVFLSECIREFFRLKIGLPAEPAPLVDAELLGACRLINRYSFAEAGFPTEGVLKIREHQSSHELVSIAKKHLDLLRVELKRFIDHLKSNPDYARFFYKALSEAERYSVLFQ
jgi:hypothetical protein